MPVFLLAALILALSSPPLIAGSTYFVSKNGGDSEAGTRAQPWGSIQHAIDRLQPGDTAVILTGTYHEKLEFNRSGKKDSPLTLRAEGDVTISGKRRIGDNLIYLNDKAGIVFGGYSQKADTVSECRFENNTCYKNTGHKKANAEIWIQFADNNRITRNILYGTKNKPILFAEKNAGKNNLLFDNQYFNQAAKAEFGWRGKFFEGWSKFSAAVPQGAGAKFADPRFPNPEMGRFE